MQSSSKDQAPEVVTFGCRLNLYESEVIKANAAKAGLKGAIIFNTCSVTEEAERQARQAIRKAKRDHPDRSIIVTGCSAQISPEKYLAMDEVDHVIGNDLKMDLKTWETGLTKRHQGGDIFDVKELAPHLLSGFEEKTRAYVQVQNGCDHRCTFCQIPYGRGQSRSQAMGPLFDQVRHFVAQGVKEIVLTGVDITSYGKDLPGEPTLGQMMRRLMAHVPELPRLRLSSIDPAACDEDIFWLLAHEPRFMPHLHISLQAGDDLILKRMKRRHLRHDLISFCERARSVRPEVVFGADMIAGFPTETEAHFQNSLRIIDELGITYVHVFPYSPRPGTPASRMPQVEPTIIKERARLLREAALASHERFLKSLVGTTQEILVERGQKGLTSTFAPVHFEENLLVGSIQRLTIFSYNEGILKGRTS